MDPSTYPYLSQLRVENLLVIEAASLDLHPGFNVLSGETGAGKTVLTKGLDLLLGAKTPKQVVRPEASDAYVEGVFTLPPTWLVEHAGETQHLSDFLDLSEDEVVLARRITSGGRSRCFINGRTVSLDALRELAQLLIAFYGQHEQRRLMLEEVQTQLLDQSGDGRGEALRANYQLARREAAQAARHLEALRGKQAYNQRELELARFELQELEDTAPEPGEEGRLLEELRKLEQAEQGRSACALGVSLLSGDDEGQGVGARDLADQAQRALEPFSTGEAEALKARIQGVSLELADIADELMRLGEGWESNPQRQEEVSQRLEVFHSLTLKHRCSFEQLFERWEELRATVSAADEMPLRLQEAEASAQKLLQAAEEAASALTRWRSKAAPKLSKSVNSVLGELAFQGATFDIELRKQEGAGLGGLGDSGAEKVVFTFQANPGLPVDELAKVASGGEQSRLMLALTSCAPSTAAGVLVLDEPDTGLGGQTAHGVAERLCSLSADRQVVVISHLPQIAARADRNFLMDKRTQSKTTRTEIHHLADEEAVLDELCRMAGHAPDDADARRAAAKLRQRCRG